MSMEAAGDRRLWQPASEFSRLYANGEEDASVDVAVEALRSDIPFEPPFESIWWLADQLRKRRHFTLALELVESAFERGFRGWRIFYLRALFRALLRDFSEAFNFLDSSIRIAPDEEARKMALFRGRLLAATGEYQEALRCFRENLKFGEDPAALVDAGIRIAWRAENGDIARRWLNRANRFYGANVERIGEFARRCYDRGLWDLSRESARQGLDIESGNLTLERLVCLCLYNEGKTVEAIPAIEKLLRSDPDWLEGQEMLARCLGASGRKEEAAQILARTGENANGANLVGLRKELGLSKKEISAAPADRKSARRLQQRIKKNPMKDSELLHRLNNIPPDFTPRWTDETIEASGNTFRAVGSLIHSVRTIILRETMARFGRHDLGYLWAIIEPLIHVTVLSFIFYYIRMKDTLGMNVVLFVATGIIPLFFYLKTYTALTNALKQNRPLLNHASVQPMDIFLARATLEFFTQLLVLVIFAAAIYFAVEQYRFGSILSVVANLFGLWITGIGMGLIIGSLVVYAESLPNIMTGFNRIIYITSGVFFTLDMMPASVAEYVAYNPLLHFVDGVRGNFNPLMGGTRVDIGYAYMWAIGIFTLGLIADRALRHKVLDR